MQIVTYRVKVINSNGSVSHGDDVEFIDSVSIKQVRAAVAEQHQRNPDNVIVTEAGRVSV